MKGDQQKTKVNALERALKLERFKFSTKFKLREQFIYVPIDELNIKLGLPKNSYMGLFSTIKLDIPE